MGPFILKQVYKYKFSNIWLHKNLNFDSNISSDFLIYCLKQQSIEINPLIVELYICYPKATSISTITPELKAKECHNCHASGKYRYLKMHKHWFQFRIALKTENILRSNFKNRKKIEKREKHKSRTAWGAGRCRKLSRKWHKYILRKSSLSNVKTIFALFAAYQFNFIETSTKPREQLPDWKWDWNWWQE